MDPSKTCQVLLAAGKHLVSSGRPLLYADSGVENVNWAVDSTLFSACLERILAQVEVAFSNSMIEAFWRVDPNQALHRHAPVAHLHLREIGHIIDVTLLIGQFAADAFRPRQNGA